MHGHTLIKHIIARFFDRMLRNILEFVLPYPNRFRILVRVGRFAKPVAKLLKLPGNLFGRIANSLDLIPNRLKTGTYTTPGEFISKVSNKRGRVALLSGCAQQVLDPSINDATIRLLNRIGYDVVIPAGETCCGALTHHLGKEESALQFVRKKCGCLVE